MLCREILREIGENQRNHPPTLKVPYLLLVTTLTGDCCLRPCVVLWKELYYGRRGGDKAESGGRRPGARPGAEARAPLGLRRSVGRGRARRRRRGCPGARGCGSRRARFAHAPAPQPPADKAKLAAIAQKQRELAEKLAKLRAVRRNALSPALRSASRVPRSSRPPPRRSPRRPRPQLCPARRSGRRRLRRAPPAPPSPPRRSRAPAPARFAWMPQAARWTRQARRWCAPLSPSPPSK